VRGLLARPIKDTARAFQLICGSPSSKSSLVDSRFIPQSEFNSIVYPDFVVNEPELVANDVLPDAQFLPDLMVLQASSNKFDHAANPTTEQIGRGLRADLAASTHQPKHPVKSNIGIGNQISLLDWGPAMAQLIIQVKQRQ
jgi:hypothetical protein